MPKRGANLEEKQRWMRERHASSAAEPPRPFPPEAPPALERHYTTQELSKMWGFDQTTIRRMFQDEPGALKYGKAHRHDGKRDYVSIRIPESIAIRVHQERSQ